uniref:Uncharacterized protein n=1 Tax=Megaviridae environmental sample TaxID=1737588 RepID=A0A5J6VI71_9VIRU|nr:MAG: hypothetical protein [Megaviridae environmental sample]
MGYTTDFYGEITINKPIDIKTREFLHGLSSTRRMKRNPKILSNILNISEKECLEKYGKDCKHYFGCTINDKSIIKYNSPPADQPGLWCDWCLGDDKKSITWNKNEKFYNYIEWMSYIVKELKSRGYTLNGKIRWAGKDYEDKGIIKVTNNIVEYIYV